MFATCINEWRINVCKYGLVLAVQEDIAGADE